MLKIKLYVLDSGRLREKPVPAIWTTEDLGKYGYAGLTSTIRNQRRLFSAVFCCLLIFIARSWSLCGQEELAGCDFLWARDSRGSPGLFRSIGKRSCYLRLVLSRMCWWRFGPARCLRLMTWYRAWSLRMRQKFFIYPRSYSWSLTDLADLNVRAQIEVRDEIARMAKAWSKTRVDHRRWSHRAPPEIDTPGISDWESVLQYGRSQRLRQ